MSRIGKLPIAIPAGVTVTVDGNNVVTVKGAKGELKQQVAPSITVKVENGHVELRVSTMKKLTVRYMDYIVRSSTTW